MKEELGVVNLKWIRKRIKGLTQEVKTAENGGDLPAAAAFHFHMQGYIEVLEHAEKETKKRFKIKKNGSEPVEEGHEINDNVDV